MTPIAVHCRAMHFDNALGEPCLLGLCFLHNKAQHTSCTFAHCIKLPYISGSCVFLPCIRV